jgi:heat shock protein HslJ
VNRMQSFIILMIAVILGQTIVACVGVESLVATPEPEPPVSGEGFATLDGTSWRLETIQGEPVLPGTEPTLVFEDGNAGGTTGCNSFGGPYVATGEAAIQFAEIASTQMACMDPDGVMEQEIAYLSMLQSATDYRVEGDRLELHNDLGETVLAFSRAE